jgi:predicted Zn-dependent protease
MNGRLRWAATGSMVVGVVAISWVIAEHATPPQPLSLSVLVDGGTEAMRTVDRLGKIATRIPVAEEIEIGDRIAQQLEPVPADADVEVRGGPLADAEAYLQAVVDTLAAAGGLRRPEIRYRAAILDTAVINAFAIPGGHVYITTGMLEFLENEAELAAIIGHEMAHVDLAHCIERLQYERLAEKIAGPPAEVLVSIGYRMFSIGYSDELEAEADRQGTLYAERAGYHPQAGQVLFDRLAARVGAGEERDSVGREIKGMVSDALSDYFGTHPRDRERIANFERTFAEQRFDLENRAYYLGRLNLDQMTCKRDREISGETVTGRIFDPF